MNPAVDSVAEADGGEEGEKFAVGNVYEVKLTTGIEFEGIVLAYDVDSDIVIFEEDTKTRPGNSKNTRMVKESSINEIKYLAKVKDPLYTKNGWIDLDGLIDKEELAIREIKGESIGVTAEAQSIFEALSKNFSEVEWKNSKILVLGEVYVCSPYSSKCVTGDNKINNNRVMKALDIERKKLQLSGT